MADFFRYNVKKGSRDATIREEVEAAENYVYILNVRFAGDIRYQSRIDEEAMDFSIPSMILQPLVENAVNHGIRNIERPGEIYLTVENQEENIEIRIRTTGPEWKRKPLTGSAPEARLQRERYLPGSAFTMLLPGWSFIIMPAVFFICSARGKIKEPLWY